MNTEENERFFQSFSKELYVMVNGNTIGYSAYLVKSRDSK